jgi:hypothetical protein
MLGTNISVDNFGTWSIEAGKITYSGIYQLLSGVMFNTSLLCALDRLSFLSPWPNSA